jgi:hypothetical protein
MARLKFLPEVDLNPAYRYKVMTLSVLTVVSSVCAQGPVTPRYKHNGVSQDWSQHHIIFTREGVLKHPEVLSREPVFWNRQCNAGRHPNPTFFRAAPIMRPL